MSQRTGLLASLAVWLVGYSMVAASEWPTVEVFTTVDFPFVTHNEAYPIEVYAIDSIQRLETELSRGLTADVDSAKRLARKRVAIVDDTQRKHVQQAATGLAKAMQYGIDRYPAVVFDAEAVVYGVADLKTALHRYRRWREASAQ